MNSLAPFPKAPSMSEWTFLEQFKKHQHTMKRKSFQVSSDAINLSEGVSLKKISYDQYLMLETAYQDFSRFLADIQIPEGRGHEFRFEFDYTLHQETFILEVKKNGGLIRIADIEAGRRAIYFLIDEIISCGGNTLAIQNYRREPFVKTRISRCYYGPKKRPPLFKTLLLLPPAPNPMSIVNLKFSLINHHLFSNDLAK